MADYAKMMEINGRQYEFKDENARQAIDGLNEVVGDMQTDFNPMLMAVKNILIGGTNSYKYKKEVDLPVRSQDGSYIQITKIANKHLKFILQERTNTTVDVNCQWDFEGTSEGSCMRLINEQAPYQHDGYKYHSTKQLWFYQDDTELGSKLIVLSDEEISNEDFSVELVKKEDINVSAAKLYRYNEPPKFQSEKTSISTTGDVEVPIPTTAITILFVQRAPNTNSHCAAYILDSNRSGKTLYEIFNVGNTDITMQIKGGNSNIVKINTNGGTSATLTTIRLM